MERHTVKNKKLLVNDRLKLLFDNVENLLEISPLAGLGMKYGDVPRGGLITGTRFVNFVEEFWYKNFDLCLTYLYNEN